MQCALYNAAELVIAERQTTREENIDKISNIIQNEVKYKASIENDYSKGDF